MYRVTTVFPKFRPGEARIVNHSAGVIFEHVMTNDFFVNFYDSRDELEIDVRKAINSETWREIKHNSSVRTRDAEEVRTLLG